MTAIAVFAIYFTLPAIALSALPVKLVHGEYQTLLALPPSQGGFQVDPVLGVVENLGITGVMLDELKIYVGLLAATILFIATNAGVIGASRITYAMASYRQLPEIFRRVHPRFKTPWISIVFFAGIVSIATLIPGKVDFLGTMYSFGAMLSFTIAHLSRIALRAKRPDEELVFRGRPNIRVRGVAWPVFAFVGAIATGVAWVVVVVQTPLTRYAGLGWLAVGFLVYFVYRRRVVHAPLTQTVRAPIILGPGAALEYRNLLVPVARGSETGEALDVACRLATERRARVSAIAVIEIPLELPIDAVMPEAELEANELLDHARTVGDSYGVDVVGRLVRDRRAGRAIVREAEQRNSEIIVMGAPRQKRSGAPILGETPDFVLKHAQCRVMVVAAREAA
jgi:APA family basic amino acid/polyamine antiporter